MSEDPNTPAPGSTALLIVDMINDLDFGGGKSMRPAVQKAAEAIAKLRAEADKAHVPVVYVNDNYGQWHSQQSKIVEYCMREGSHGRDIIRTIAPREDDYFIIKPQFSGFYSTNLPVLLPQIGVSRLILTGIAADICILFTAADAHMREYDLWVPRDAVASQDGQRTEWALEIMKTSMDAETRPTDEFALAEWIERADSD
ncbi:Nicotinamidase-related amidase [Faunimonas pinastri]|uniref:Nicotinamidase-related amidase n=1 Tax=Faunimonas pinastri TaxID=1855383 RepID=A0A1H9Q195_9HYPH|nr:isochorismatase family cysteine hydrolase [Faunimonas pinastri]SER54227.1 Nicotinamidase-related amidase [Faunimonas pinastri]